MTAIVIVWLIIGMNTAMAAMIENQLEYDDPTSDKEMAFILPSLILLGPLTYFAWGAAQE